MNRIIHLLLLLCLSLAAHAQSLKGHITLSDTLPGTYATIHIPSLGITEVANEYGDYRFRSLPAGTYEAEFSRIGFAKHKTTVSITGDQTTVLDVNMEAQPIGLPTAYALPNGQDPAAYILGKMWAKAEANRQKLNYKAKISYDFAAYNFDIINAAQPFYKRMLKMLLGIGGYKPLATTIMENESPFVSVEMTRTYSKGRTTDADKRIAESNYDMTDAEKKFFLNPKKFLNKNIFDEAYDYYLPWGKNGKQRKRFVYEGSYTEDGRTIDVLTCRTKKVFCSLHIIEDDWQILKARIVESADEVTDIICQNVSGIYMPISVSQRVTVLEIPPQQFDEYSELCRQVLNGAAEVTTPEGKTVKVSPKLKKRIEKVYPLMERMERTKKPLPLSVNFNYNIKYQ